MSAVQPSRYRSQSCQNPATKFSNHGALTALSGTATPLRLSPPSSSYIIPETQYLKPPQRPISKSNGSSLVSDEVFANLELESSSPANHPHPDRYYNFHMDPPRLHPRSRSSSSSASSRVSRSSSTLNTVSSSTSRTSSPDSVRSTIGSRSLHYSDPATYTSFFDAPAPPISGSKTNYQSAQRRSASSQRRPDVSQRALSWDAKYYAPGQAVDPTRRPPLRHPNRVSAPSTVRYAPASGLRNKPGEAFQKLPKEVLDIILDNLRNLHLSKRNGRTTCSTCWMRDACAMALVNRQCFRSAQGKLYNSIWLVGPDFSSALKRSRIKSGSRLRALRMTLMGNPALAKHVKEVKFPEQSEGLGQEEREKYMELVAGIIVACPNLEKALGLSASYRYQHSQPAHALSSRTKLKEHVWDIYSSPLVPAKRWTWSSKAQNNEAKGPSLSAQQSRIFVDQHQQWDQLETLVVRCASGGTVDSSTLSSCIDRLPSLKHLCLSSIPHLSPEFLAGLPPLQSLHLDNISTVSAQSLSSFVTTPQAATLTSLSLIHVSLSSLPVLARLFSNLISLKSFILIQDESPTLPIGTSIYLHPYLASQTLETLTWDILQPANLTAANATAILAKAIEANGFPKLHRIKAPCDYEGRLQAICQPFPYTAAPPPSLTSTEPHPSFKRMPEPNRKDSGISEISLLSITLHNKIQPTRSLTQSRASAQVRHEEAQKHACFHILVQDFSAPRDPRFVASFEFGGFVGKIGTDCRIVYDLNADVGGKDEVGVVVGDILRGNREAFGSRGGGEGRRRDCDGRWNDGKASSWKRDARRKGEHRERENWKPFELKRLF